MLLTLTPSLPKLLSYFQLDAQPRVSDKTHLFTHECVNLVFAEEAKSQSHTSRFSLFPQFCLLLLYNEENGEEGWPEGYHRFMLQS